MMRNERLKTYVYNYQKSCVRVRTVRMCGIDKIEKILKNFTTYLIYDIYNL